MNRLTALSLFYTLVGSNISQAKEKLSLETFDLCTDNCFALQADGIEESKYAWTSKKWFEDRDGFQAIVPKDPTSR